MSQAILNIDRKKDTEGVLRKYKVLLDGECIGKVAKGEVATFSVQPGEYNVQIACDWEKSRPMAVPFAEGQTITFEVTNPHSVGGSIHKQALAFLLQGNQTFELRRVR